MQMHDKTIVERRGCCYAMPPMILSGLPMAAWPPTGPCIQTNQQLVVPLQAAAGGQGLQARTCQCQARLLS